MGIAASVGGQKAIVCRGIRLRGGLDGGSMKRITGFVAFRSDLRARIGCALVMAGVVGRLLASLPYQFPVRIRPELKLAIRRP